MGWTTVHRDPGLSNDEFFRQEFPDLFGGRGELVASGNGGTTYYAAVRLKESGEVHALVILTNRNTHRGEYFNFGYKEMSESMGPGEDSCPRQVLDALTPTDSEWANDWRERCRQRLARRLPKRGDLVRFDSPLKFRSGAELSELRFDRYSTFTDASGRRYRITNWRERGFTVVDPPAPELPTSRGSASTQTATDTRGPSLFD